MLGKDVVHVRGYHIMPWSWHGAESAGLMLAAWFRELRRAGFSLSVSDSQDKKSGSREAMEKQGLIDECRSTGEDTHRKLSNTINAAITYFEDRAAMHGSESSPLNTAPVQNACNDLHFLTAISCATDVRALAASASWLEREHAEIRGSGVADHSAHRSSNAKGVDTGCDDHSGVRVQTRGERGRDSGKEKDSARENERGSKRLRTRASSGSNRAKDSNEVSEGKKGTAFASAVSKQHDGKKSDSSRHSQTGQNMEKKSESMRQTVQNIDEIDQGPSLKKARLAGSEMSCRIVQGLLHRKVAQSSFSPLCQELLRAFQVQACAAGEVLDGKEGTPGRGDSEDVGGQTSQQAKPDDADDRENESEEASAKDMEKEPSALQSKLADADRKKAALQRQLVLQREQISRQTTLIHRLQAKQDLDAARANESGGGNQLLPCDSARETRNMTCSLKLLSCLSAYVGSAALSTRLYAAQNLCKAASEARVLVAMLISEQVELRQRLVNLRKNASPPDTSSALTETPTLNTTAPSSSLPIYAEGPSTGAGVGEACGGLKSGGVLPAVSAISSVDGTNAAPMPAVQKCSKNSSEDARTTTEIAKEVVKVEAQLRSKAQLVLEMTSAGIVSILFCVFSTFTCLPRKTLSCIFSRPLHPFQSQTLRLLE